MRTRPMVVSAGVHGLARVGAVATGLGERQRGVVRSFFQDQGFGVITHKVTGQDYYVSYQAVQGKGFKTLNVGEEVDFTTSTYLGKPVAEKVWRLGKPSPSFSG